MNSPTHIIDPDGEVIIILLNANIPIAQMDENPFTKPDSDISSPLCDKSQIPSVTEVSQFPLKERKLTAKEKKALKRKKKMRQSGTILAALESTSPAAAPTLSSPFVEGYPAEDAPAEDAPAEAPAAEEYPAEDAPAEDAPAEDAPAEDVSAEAPVAEDNLAEEPTAEEPAVEEAISEESFAEVSVQSCFRIQVSAKHLMFASPVFKKILTGGWKESITYFQKGSVEITAETWDIDALMIVLQAMHCQHYLISEILTLDMLAKVAVIADYYECKNALP